jgi:hypothetical protein
VGIVGDRIRAGSPCPARNRASLRLKMFLNRFDGSPKSRIGLGQAHAIEHKADSPNIEPL